MIKKIISEYKWLKFVDKHSELVIEREQCEITNIIVNCAMPLKKRFLLYIKLTFRNQIFLVFVLIPIVIFCEIYSFAEEKLKMNHAHNQITVDTREIHKVFTLLRESIYELTDYLENHQHLLSEINHACGLISHLRPPHNHDEEEPHYMHVGRHKLIDCCNRIAWVKRQINILHNQRHLHPDQDNLQSIRKISEAYNIIRNLTD